MRFTLNGWRRIGIVVVSLWIIVLLAVTFTEYSIKSAGFFVVQNIPVGTVIDGNKVTLPDGKVITISEEEEFKLRLAKERNLTPWQIDWSEITSVPKVAEVRWQRLGLLVLFAPLIIWLFAEVAVLTVFWVRRGFVAGERRDS